MIYGVESLFYKSLLLFRPNIKKFRERYKIPKIPRACAKCNQIRPDSKPLQCRCQRVRYCSEACQREHWARHKPECVKGKAYESEAVVAFADFAVQKSPLRELVLATYNMHKKVWKCHGLLILFFRSASALMRQIAEGYHPGEYTNELFDSQFNPNREEDYAQLHVPGDERNRPQFAVSIGERLQDEYFFAVKFTMADGIGS
jgi:hypothetical protein